jgi:hypothetical protein
MYTYAFLPSTVPDLELPEGIVGSLQLIATPQLAALVEPDLAVEVLQDNETQLLQAVLSHDRVIRELFEQTTVLPLRFGTCFVSQQGLVEHLESHRSDYLDKLDGLQGKAEYPLKLVPKLFPESPIGAEVTGKAYFLAKKQNYEAQTTWQTQQQTERDLILAAIAHSHPQSLRSEPEQQVERIYILGDRQDEATLRKAIGQWQTQSPHWEITLGEGLPPYHFV